MLAAPSRSFRRRCAIAAGGLILAGGLATAFADVSGDLDGGFGTGGVVTTGISQHGDDAARAIAVQGDGKIVAVGRSGDRISVARYHPDGSLDTDSDADPGSHLGGDGTVTTSFGANTDARANGVAIQPDGKIVVVGKVAPPFDFGGESPGDFAVARYEPDGDLDTGFSTDGLVTTEIPGGGGSEAYDVAVQGDGKIVAVGDSCGELCGEPGVSSEFTIVRYHADGGLDTNSDADPGTHFDTDGIAITDFGGHERASGIAIQADGKIVAGGGGSTSDFEFTTFAIARYSAANGSLDAGFGSGGKVTTSGFGGEGVRADLALQSGGEIVVAGQHLGDGNDGDFALARFLASGSADTSFGGGDGRVTTDFGNFDAASAVAVSGGAIVAAGTSRTGGEFGGPSSFAVARYESDGDLDGTFSTDGKLTTDLGARTTDEATGVAIDGGEPIVAGSSRGIEEHSDHVREMPSDFVLARYESDGDPKTGFGGDGLVETQIGSIFGDRANASAAQDDRKIVAVGSTVDEQGAHDDEDVVIARYHPDGTLDTNADADPGVHFGGGDGVLTTDLSGADLNDTANAVAIQDDGKIVIAGSADAAILVARFDASGTPDAGFGGGDGNVVSDFGGLDEAKGIAIHPTTGSILVTGGSNPNGLAMARYTASGTPDSSFGGGDGEVVDPFFAGYATGSGIAIQPDEKIVVSGGGNEGGTEGFAVARYTPAGSPDNTFAGNGKRVTNFFAGTNDVSTDVAVRPDGKIVAMGTADIPDTPVADCGGPASIDYGLARYNADGSLDNTFGNNGKVTTDIGNTADNGYAAVVQPEGPILLAGRAGSDFSLARYEPGGDIDTTFSNDGRVTTDLSACDVARDVALSDDGLLVTGTTVDGQGSHFTLVRYLWQEHAANAATPPDGSVSTAGTLGPSNPVITEVTTPSGGEVEITEAAGSAGEAPTGYTLLNFLIAITAPTESSSDPLEIVFNLDDAQLPPGGVAAVDVYRNGVVLSDCTLAGEIPLGETACVKAREAVGDDGKVTILTVEASDWEFTLRPALVDASVPAKMKVGPATRNGVPVTFDNRYAQSTDTILLRRKGKTVGSSVNTDQPAGESTIEVKPRRSAGRKLRRLDRVRIQVKITAEAPGTDPASLTRSILLKG